MGSGGWGTTRSKRPLSERLWARVDQSGGPDACWPWTGAIKGNGYGEIMERTGGRAQIRSTHRVAYELTNGPVPDGLHVMHDCDNKRCCNPAHLRAGTHAENMADAAAKLLHRRKLTVEQAIELRALYAAGAPMATITARFGISEHAAYMCAVGRTWRHLGTPGPRPDQRRRLTDDDVQEIQRLRAAGLRLKEIGQRFGIGESMVCRITRGNRRAA